MIRFSDLNISAEEEAEARQVSSSPSLREVVLKQNITTANMDDTLTIWFSLTGRSSGGKT